MIGIVKVTGGIVQTNELGKIEGQIKTPFEIRVGKTMMPQEKTIVPKIIR